MLCLKCELKRLFRLYFGSKNPLRLPVVPADLEINLEVKPRRRHVLRRHLNERDEEL